MKLNKLGEAANLLQRTYTLREERFGVDNPEVSKEIHDIVQQLRENGQYWQAEAMLKKGLAQREKRMVPRNSSTAEFPRI